METTISTYEQSALDFLAATQTTFSAEFLKYGKHFDDDKDDRDIYKITLKRGGRSYSFNFGQSIAKSCKWVVKDKNPKLTKVFDDKMNARSYASRIGNSFNVNVNPEREAPSAYNVLTCLTKYDPGTLDNFCDEFGYSTDSKKAEKTYNAVREEYLNVSRLFNESELEQLREIQ